MGEKIYLFIERKLPFSTDPPNPHDIPGFAIHDELEQLISMSLSPFDTLQTYSNNRKVFLAENPQNDWLYSVMIVIPMVTIEEGSI